jgi:hypothetical protein
MNKTKMNQLTFDVLINLQVNLFKSQGINCS